MPSLNIFQIYYSKEHLACLDSAFIPYDNSLAGTDREFEFGVFWDHYKNNKHLEADYSGYVSWKFNEKLRVPGKMFVDFIKINPGYDVYFINPFPSEAHWKNVWAQGDNYHPEITAFTQSLLDKLNYKVDLSAFNNHIDTLAYCNYWVGNSNFWQRYMEFVAPLYGYIKNELTHQEKEFIERPADQVIDAHYFPFIFERMFSTFLATSESGIRYFSMNKYYSQNNKT